MIFAMPSKNISAKDPSRKPNAPSPKLPANPPILLAPAGDWDCLRAAVNSGANAVYFGLDRFNARKRAKNFPVEDLPEIMRYLHRNNVQGFITFNTLTFDNELPAAKDYLRSIIAAGTDAAIVQDIGICKLIRGISPDFPIHASTQMSISSAAGIVFSEKLGASMTALARECSVAEIAKIQNERRQRDTGRTLFPLEVFIHGALCISCSGQCLASESMGARSANRGECAQPCRLPYTLIHNGEPLNSPKQYFLSPQDLIGLEHILDLILAGVTCFKIEGRLKSPEYVASITSIYRRTIDTVWDLLQQNTAPDLIRQELSRIRRRTDYEMQIIFSRGLSSGWMAGTNHQQLIHGFFSNSRGLLVGKVAPFTSRHCEITVATHEKISPGDGIAFADPVTKNITAAGRVYTVRRNRDLLQLGFENGNRSFANVREGDLIYKTDDPALNKVIHHSLLHDKPAPVSLTLTVSGKPGDAMTAVFRDKSGNSAAITSDIPLENALKQPLTTERLLEQFGRLGDTPFQLVCVENCLQGNCILPIKELNRMRRELCDQLIAQRETPQKWQINAMEAPDPQKWIPSPLPQENQLLILVRNMTQLDAALTAISPNDANISIYCDFYNLGLYPEAIQKIKAHGLKVAVAGPRIFKQGEENLLEQLFRNDADAFLVRNYNQLEYGQGKNCIGDYNFNVANAITAETYLTQFALKRLTLSYDLNLEQTETLLKNSDPGRFEYTLHQHIPMFHTAHCLFCANLTRAEAAPKCGKACQRNQIALLDRTNIPHPVQSDAGCRNTVYNGRIQTACEYLPSLHRLGLRFFRIEFVEETQEQVAATVALYRRLLRFEISGEDVWCSLKAQGLALTRGDLDNFSHNR